MICIVVTYHAFSPSDRKEIRHPDQNFQYKQKHKVLNMRPIEILTAAFVKGSSEINKG